MGEPSGIATEITLKAYQAIHQHSSPEGGLAFYLIDDPARVETVSRNLGYNIKISTISSPSETHAAFKHGMPVLALSRESCQSLQNVSIGKPNTGTAKAFLESIELAISHCKSGLSGGVVTNPIQKETLIESGFKFSGHTEYLGELTNEMPLLNGMDRGPVMMLACPTLRVAIATTHIPISNVPKALSRETITKIGRVVTQALIRDFGIQAPKLAISGLNPHAGEGGKLGTEDLDIIAPAVRGLREMGVNAIGPLPADTMFHEEARQVYDAALAMYHDQGLVPIKTLAFHEAVNVTLGLPIVRTSPDHGTGLNIAGQNIARPDSLFQAIVLAQHIAINRNAFDQKLA